MSKDLVCQKKEIRCDKILIHKQMLQRLPIALA